MTLIVEWKYADSKITHTSSHYDIATETICIENGFFRFGRLDDAEHIWQYPLDMIVSLKVEKE